MQTPSKTLYSVRPPILLVSILLPRLADKDFVSSTLWSLLVASTACVDLDAFSSECSKSSVDSGNNNKTDLSLQLSRFQPLNHPHSPVDFSSDSQDVVESPSHYEAPAVPVNISALIESVVQQSQISALSSVQLFPNRMREDYSYATMDVFPVFQVSPETDGYLPAMSPVTPPVTDFSGHIGPGLSATGSNWEARQSYRESGYDSVLYRAGNRFVTIVASVDSTSG